MPTQMKNATPTYGTRAATRQREQLDADDEEQRDADQQPDAVDARREPAVERHESHQHQRLSGRGVRPHLGAAAEQDQRLAHGLDHRVADEQQEDVDQHQHRRRAFAGADVGERADSSVDPSRRSGLVGATRNGSAARVRGIRWRLRLRRDIRAPVSAARASRAASTTSSGRVVGLGHGQRAGELEQMHFPPAVWRVSLSQRLARAALRAAIAQQLARRPAAACADPSRGTPAPARRARAESAARCAATAESAASAGAAGTSSSACRPRTRSWPVSR